jgi:hypothetical protein
MRSSSAGSGSASGGLLSLGGLALKIPCAVCGLAYIRFALCECIDSRMFKCMSFSKVAHDASDTLTAADMRSMGKKSLINLCVAAMTERNYLRKQVETLQESCQQTNRSWCDIFGVEQGLHSELSEKIKMLEQKIVVLENERLNQAETLHDNGLCNKIRVLEQKISSLGNERPAHIPQMERIKVLVEEARNCIIDPVTHQPFSDPIHLCTGHVYNRSTLLSRVKDDRIHCPLKETSVYFKSERIAVYPKILVVEKLTDIVLRLVEAIH